MFNGKPQTLVSQSARRSLHHAKENADAFGSPFNDRPHTYVCPQTLCKFHPDFDEVLAGILNGDVLAKIVLLEGRVEH